MRTLRLTTWQQAALKRLLFVGDGYESVALGLCGMRCRGAEEIYCVHELCEVPPAVCTIRTATTVQWPLEPLIPLLSKAATRNLAVLKIHSHPDGFSQFSSRDDDSDRVIGAAFGRILERRVTHLSGFMQPDGHLRVRAVQVDGEMPFVDRVVIVGDDIRIQGRTHATDFDEADLRTRQAFGEGTTRLLKSLRVGVAGCSGTGSWVVELLGRLGVGSLVLVDPDVVERKNLNRIINSSAEDAALKCSKAEVLASAVRRMGLGTNLQVFTSDLCQRPVVEALASCDVLFGCLDSADGRELLNRIATYYLIPYFDLGVRIDADSQGGVEQICGALHFLLPGGSSLLSRGVITPEQVHAQAMQRNQPDKFEALAREGYVKGLQVDRPAVVSLNGFIASHAVNELLARVHPFRREANSEFRYQLFSLADGGWLRLPDGPACAFLAKFTGRGDTLPMLGNPALS